MTRRTKLYFQLARELRYGIATAKYADGLPLYRLSTILKRHGIELTRQTLSESVLSIAHKIESLIAHMRSARLQGDVIYMD